MVELEQESLQMEKKPTWEELMQAWRQWLAAANYAEHARIDFPQKVQLLRRFLAQTGHLDAQERIDLDGIEPATMSDYQAFVYQYISPKTGKPLVTQSQIHALSYVKSFFRFLHKTGRIAFDPTKIIRLPRHPQRLPTDLLSVEEARRLMAVPDLGTPTGYRDRCMLELLWCTGMRIGELLSLGTGDLDFPQRLVHIRRGKGGRPRTIPLGAAAAEWLQEYIKEVRPWLEQGAPAGTPPCAILFLSRFGRVMDKSGFFYKLRAYQNRAKLKRHLTPHTFRHTLASEMMKRGADLRHIQELLGHHNLTTTQRYLHIVKGELKKVHGKTHPREKNPPGQGPDYRGSKE